MAQLLATLAFGLIVLTSVVTADDGPLPLPKDAPRLSKDVTVVVAGSSISINRYGCADLPAWTGGVNRVPPQANGQNVFFRIWEMLNDHENMCWRRLTDKDWTRTGVWPAEKKLAYNGSCYGLRVAYAASQPGDHADLAVPAGYEKIDLIYTTDLKGDKIKVTIDGQPPAENAVIDSFQPSAIPADADAKGELATLDSHGEPVAVKRPTTGIANLCDIRARYRLDPAKPHVLRVERGTADAGKRVLIWGAVYWRGNCVQVVQRSKGGINCGDLPNFHAIQEVMAAKPDYLLVEAINIRNTPADVTATLESPLAWCGKQAKDGRFKALVYMTSMGNSKSFRAWFTDPKHNPPYGTGKLTPADVVADANADTCVAVVTELAKKNGLPLIDVGPRADRWLAENPVAKFVPHVQVDWYHPNQWGAAVFGMTIHDGIGAHWPELPVRPVRSPPPPVP